MLMLQRLMTLVDSLCEHCIVHCSLSETCLMYLEFGCLCPVVVHNDYVVLDRRTHNTFTGTTILL
jgi:hypothetical protein